MIWLLLLCAMAMPLANSKKECDIQNYHFYPYFSSHTAYRTVRGEFKKIEDCKAEKIWVLNRHGTRYPPKHDIKKYKKMTELRDKILENHERNERGMLTESELKMFRDWRFNVKKHDALLLTHSGKKELRHLGDRLIDIFPELLGHYSPNEIKINYTSAVRTKQSAEAVTAGMYGQSVEMSDSMIDDDLLQSGSNCPAWEKSQRNPNIDMEVESFINGTAMQQALSDVSKRLGFENNISMDTLKSIYGLCGYETAWHLKEISPWCTAFDIKQLKALEYMKDLKKYYRSGYGNPLTVNFGCALVKDAITSLTKDDRKATLYFTHSSEIKKFLVALGLDKDHIPPTADNYESMDNRKWKTSKLTPFTANFALVLYRCPEGAYGVPEETRVAVFMNEHVVQLPNCDQKEMCGLQQFIDNYASLIDPKNCNTDFCNSEKQSRSDRDDYDYSSEYNYDDD